jgi:hypothetical protein
MRTKFEWIMEAIGWLQIVASPLLVGMLIGAVVYFPDPSPTRFVIGASIVVLGLVIGILWATRIWRTKGTIWFVSRVSATPDLDGELSKTISIAKTNLLDIIKDYQLCADKAVRIFKEKYKVNDILDGWHRKEYEQTGKLIEEGLHFYAFHGIGLAAHFNDEVVDFDFAYFPELRHDGFDLSRLTRFIQNQRHKSPDYKDKEKIKREFNELIENGVIAKPILKYPTTLYFLSETLKTEIIYETERRRVPLNPGHDSRRTD